MGSSAPGLGESQGCRWCLLLRVPQVCREERLGAVPVGDTCQLTERLSAIAFRLLGLVRRGWTERCAPSPPDMDRLGRQGSAVARTRIPRPRVVLQPIQAPGCSPGSGNCRYGARCARHGFSGWAFLPRAGCGETCSRTGGNEMGDSSLASGKLFFKTVLSLPCLWKPNVKNSFYLV